jgi:ABC-type branched-subunit amino acid transport system ATPase component
MTALLEIDGLTGGYHDTNVLFDVSLRIDTGKLLGVFGRNGVGKTTLARLVQGGIKPRNGELRYKGQSISKTTAYDRRHLGIGYMPQTSMVFDDLTVLENLTLGKTRLDPDHYFDQFPKLGERLYQQAGTMSGGERKILSFVRTLIEDTDLIILDEPSEGVQPENIEQMASCLQERVSDGAGIMLIEQNLGFLTKIADQYLGLDSGRTIYEGNAQDISVSQIRSFLTV